MIVWTKCPAVTGGGKRYFLFGKKTTVLCSDPHHTYHIVWDRQDYLYHCQVDNKTIAKFKTTEECVQYFSREKVVGNDKRD